MAGDVVLSDTGVEVKGDLVADNDVKVVGNLTAKTLSHTMVTPSVLLGRAVLGGLHRNLHVSTEHMILRWEKTAPDGSLVPVLAGDDPKVQNIALSHLDGNRLGLNHGSGFTGGTVVEGNAEVTGRLVVGGRDILAELDKLKK